MRIFDFNHPSHRPLWLRVAIVTFAIGWAVFEFTQGNSGWAIFFGLIGMLALWGFFVVFDPREPDSDEEIDP